ncbi:hypothetical protein [Leifsonia aquatica]|uniref:hypothetical protein n=1 Tax=Leifsonia aquatica TaxID=144185 RepID=UPI0037F24D27
MADVADVVRGDRHAAHVIQRWIDAFTWKMLVFATALFVMLVAVWLILLALTAAPPSVRSFVFAAFIAAFAAALICTVVTGIAVTAVIPPLRPVAEISVLGRRVMAFVKFGLATAALFSTAFITWLVAKTYDYYYDNHLGSADPTGQLSGTLGSALGFAAFVFWIWLSIDLLRIGARRRRSAVDVLARRMRRKPREGRVVRSICRALMGSKAWIVIAFYITPPLAVVLGTTGLRTFVS